MAALTQSNRFNHQTEYKHMSGYQTDVLQQSNNKARLVRNTIGGPSGKSRSTIQESVGKQSYQPIPDGRFYTKANFFTVADRQ